jgi:hypothetical protein
MKPDTAIDSRPIPSDALRAIAQTTTSPRVAAMCREILIARRQLQAADAFALWIARKYLGFAGTDLDNVRAYLKERGEIP